MRVVTAMLALLAVLVVLAATTGTVVWGNGPVAAGGDAIIWGT
jgi:hypothetical protein